MEMMFPRTFSIKIQTDLIRAERQACAVGNISHVLNVRHGHVGCF